MLEKGPLFVLVLLLMIGCNSAETTGFPVNEDTVLTITLNPEETYQTIEGFGASDAWSTQFVGKNWPVAKRQAIADLLFSSEMDSAGRPQGIDLSIWRFNIGAGSARQGEASGIGDPWRRAESFLTADSTYQWGKQQGQQWFMNAARQRGVETFIGFVNSPPVLLTRNGKAFGDGSPNVNLAPSNYEAYADYLARIAQYLKEEGTPFDYLSPANEPQWNWSEDNGQEGSPWLNSELAAFSKHLDKKIRQYDLNTEIVIPEAGEIDYLYDHNLNKRGKQIEYFFGSDNSLAGLQSMSHNMAAHSYFTTWPVADMIEHRKKLRNQIDQTNPSLDYWMSEYCILADNEQIQGNGRDRGMDPALYVARLIHFDLTIARASTWQWWLAVSPYDYKDGLVYIDKDTRNGRVMDSKLLWALGNYSRFIDPGSKRIGLTRSDDAGPKAAATGVMASAYHHQDSNKWTVVLVNYASRKQTVQLDWESDVLSGGSGFKPYVTSSRFDLQPLEPIEKEEQIEIPGRSIVTLYRVN